MTAHRKLIALDFDGVLHAYTSPWTDAATISDGPTPGAMRFLRQIVEDGRFDVCIVSSRCSEPDGLFAINRWLVAQLTMAFAADDLSGEKHPEARQPYRTDRPLIDQSKAVDFLRKIQVVATRPPAFLTIDDRAVTFEGTWPELDAMAAFRPWNKRGPVVPNYEAAPPPFVDVHELVRTIARRAFRAGVTRHGYDELDCRMEVDDILAEVLADEEEDRRFLEESGEAA